MPFALSPERERKLNEILERYPTRMAATLPLLHLCQEQEGYVSGEVVDYVSQAPRPSIVACERRRHLLHALQPGAGRQAPGLGLPHAAVRAARRRCDSRSIARSGSASTCGSTTPDGKVTLRTAECLASCGTAPMMQVDREYYENLTPRARRRDPVEARRKLGP
jgi:NADH-quinone oxidoreductase subunit E